MKPIHVAPFIFNGMALRLVGKFKHSVHIVTGDQNDDMIMMWKRSAERWRSGDSDRSQICLML